MFQCPHCKNNGIGIWAKFWCGSDTPAKCTSCGDLSYVHSKYRFGFQSAWPFLVSWLVIALTIYVFFISNNIYVLVAIPFIWLAGRFGELASLPLQPISAQESTASRKFGNWFMLGIAILIIAGIAAGNL
jgi:hypothetical protein